ncbi:MAG: N-acetylneuraminate synthase [Chthonomonadales bacterium]
MSSAIDKLLGNRCLIIAEAGCNHNGSEEIAIQLVDAARETGADAVKFQAFNTEALVTQIAPQAKYQSTNTGVIESQFDMIKRLELSADAHARIAAYCGQVGITYLCTPFDEGSADMLFELGITAFKLGSGEITSLPLLRHIGYLSLPILLSTGMSWISEVEEAVRAVRETGNNDIALLHCVSNYPADPADINLRVLKTMELAFGLPVGYSDHTLGNEVAIAAVAVGARCIEKHFTLDRNMEGPDHTASLEPVELRRMIEQIRNVEAAMGHGRKEPAASEADTAAVARKSLVAARDLAAGTLLSTSDFAVKRPGNGLKPALVDLVSGRTLTRSIRQDDLITFDMFK